MHVDTNTFPSYTLTPAAFRDHCNDRSGKMVGAYVAGMLMKDLNALVRFTFRKHDGTRWSDVPGCISFGLETDENERGAYNLRTNDFGGAINDAGTYQIASCADMGERFGTVRHLNPMFLACAIQSHLAYCEAKLGAKAFMEVA